jgi:predicted nucleic acid-binding protein
MRRLRLYLDTSTISEIDAESPRGEITREFFWIAVENPDEYELVISPVTMEELLDSPRNKREKFTVFVENTQHTALTVNQEAINLARIYVVENVLTDNHIDDLMHIAYAVVSRCDYVISWNMKHIVRPKTISGVNEVNFHNKFNSIMIATPQLFTGDIHNADR